MLYPQLSWAIAYGSIIANAVNVAVSFQPHEELMKEAPPGISYGIPKGTRSWSSSSRIAGSSNKLFNKPRYIQKLNPIRSSKTNSRSAAAILGGYQRQLGDGEDGEGGGGGAYANLTTTNSFGTQYAIDAVWDGSPIRLLVDTGSSDTWAIHAGYRCMNYDGDTLPQSACQFGPAQPTNFKHGLTDPTTHMSIQYGDGEVVGGPMGFSDLSVGNLTVRRQQVCLADHAYWFGNNVTSGLLGMAFPALTNSYLGDDPNDHSPLDVVEYSPFFTSLVEQGQIEPVFSIAIDRNASTGVLALGGVPPVTGLDRSKSVSLDMIITNLVNSPTSAYEYSFYTVIPDGWYYDQTTNEKKMPYIVDSGTTLCYLPPHLAQQINQSFSPPAVYLWQYGAYFTTCDARVVPVAVILAGAKFYLNPRDLIYRDIVDPVTGMCMTAISTGGTGPYILGAVFLQNALAVFDVGEAKVRFVSRVRY